VCATATDLLKWQIAVEAGSVVKASSLEMMRAPTKLRDGTFIDYGLGTRIGKLDGHHVFGHTGGGGGFNGVLASFPDDHLSIVVLMNSRSGATPSLALSAAIARAFLGLPEKKTLLDQTVPKEELTGLLGTFESEEGSVGAESSENKLEREQVLNLIDAEIQKLPTRQREAFLMRYWEDMDVAETAAAMGCSEGSVKTHCSRATHALAQALKAKGITL